MKQITAVVLGAGQRGADVYGAYALDHPTELKIVGVAEPREDRLLNFCKLHNIPKENSFTSWEQLLEKPKLADCIFICTQDKMHYRPTIEALKKGYHVLCEKPMSPYKSELVEMGKAAKESGRILSICHVLRYSPFFTCIKDLLDKGSVGQLICIQHIESVGYWHDAHSYVRGNWHKSEDTSPMILAKCCHDFDILMWLAESHFKLVSSFGNLSHFNSAHAPQDAPERCIDGCPHRDTCPYYAPRFYLEHPNAVKDNFVHILTMDTSREGIIKALKTSDYGKCVYHCDNDVVDNQVVNIEFENGVTANLTMCAFTEKCERIINIMGSKGQIKGNLEKNIVVLSDFASGNKTEFKLNAPEVGHSGSDEAMMKNFIKLVASDGKLKSLSSADISVESHMAALAAEYSRISGGIPINIKDYYK